MVQVANQTVHEGADFYSDVYQVVQDNAEVITPVDITSWTLTAHIRPAPTAEPQHSFVVEKTASTQGMFRLTRPNSTIVAGKWLYDVFAVSGSERYKLLEGIVTAKARITVLA